MKKLISVFLASLMMLLCSCAKNEPITQKTPDMLSITNDDKSFSGGKSRFNAVISAMNTKISTLEKSHNEIIRVENPQEYFLDENYILTSFEPFLLGSFSITDGFDTDMTNEKAADYYKQQSEGFDVSFSSNGESYELIFTSETLIKIYTAEYSKKTNGIRYEYSVEQNGSETVEEFLEFIQTDKNSYAIQSNTERCYIEFSEEGEIIYFSCGKLRSGKFSAQNSIFSDSGEYDGFWVTEKGKPNYLSIHTYENGILTHEDCSSGPWKTIRINADDHASAFYGQ